MKDYFLMLIGKITPEEYAHRKVQKQSVPDWYSDYDKAIKNPLNPTKNSSGLITFNKRNFSRNVRRKQPSQP